MKTRFLFFALLTGLMTQTKSQDLIPNAQFESWTTVDNQYVVPDQWQTNASADNNVIERDVNSQQGNAALRVNAFGYAMSGFGVTTHPGVVSAYVRTGYALTDTVNIQVTVFSQGNVVDGGAWTNTSDAPIPDWSYVEIPVSQNSTTADSVTINISGGQRAGTFISLDAFSLSQPVAGSNASDLINDWEVYPNPTNGYVNLKFTVPSATNLTLQLYNMQGELVSTFADNLYLWSGDYTKRLDLSALSSGSYLLNIYDGHERTSLKLLVEN